MNPTSFSSPNSIVGQLNQSMNSGAPTLDQVSQQSPNFDPSLMPAQPNAMPQGSPMSMIPAGNPAEAASMQPNAQGQVTLPVNDAHPQQPGVQVTPTEAELLIKAITKRLDHHNKMEQSIMSSLVPPQPTQA